ncbi:ABC transporter permease [Rhodococcus chondri]|uniref:Iron ABC transporter permease n=1 Tax=Rhodococcus chondri TaxID=3065941 RepID=A0ABU7JYC9_9NOCA|nr:iron ABC transporter permease [Rhodococcus sp. CC-R104]MEE2034900.1 iron ABC transporter permease [Rhodococcus sp. CC-R104]
MHLVTRAYADGPDRVWSLIFRTRTLDLVWRSGILAVTVTVACLVLGLAAAWLTTRTDLPGRGWFALALSVPLAIPSYVSGFVWIAQFPALEGFVGAALVLTCASFPYVYLPVAAALASADPGLEEVARTLGRGRVRTTLTVTLRQVWPTAAAGGLLVALYTLSDFGAVALMRYEAFTLAIYGSYRGLLDRTPAAVFGLVLVVLAIALTVAERGVRRGATARVGSGAARTPESVALGAQKWPALAFLVAVLTVSVGVPVAGLARWLWRSQQVAVDWSGIWTATTYTLWVAALGALLTTVLAVPVGVYAARSGSPLSRFTESAAYIGFALPGITVGLALVFFGIRLLPQWYQQTPMLLIAYAVLFLPLAVGSIHAAVRGVPRGLEDASATLGSGRLLTGLRVTIPLAAPGVVAGAALAFLTIAKELPATLLLVPIGRDTLATGMWKHTETLAYGSAAPYAVILVLIAALPSLILGRLLRGRVLAETGGEE